MSENGGIWTLEFSVAQTELLSDYNTFSRSQLHHKYSCKWVGLELNQQRFKLLFYRQLLIPIWEPTQDWEFGRSPRNWTSIHPLKRRLQNHSANDLHKVLTGVEPAITWVKTKRLKPFAYSTKNLAQELRFELRMLVLETRVLPNYTIPAFGSSGGI